MASTSSAGSKSNQGWTYDVFLSFAGKDTRNGFVGHLYRALDDKGIYTFRDDLQLQLGDPISSELLKSIEESRFSVVIFSEKYAASSWCLEELVKIMDCHKLMGQIVIPVFYNVDPFHVRRQIGVFDEAFQKQEARYKNDLEKVQRWKKALFEAASISGCDVSVTANGNESECIIKIVREISSKCHRSSSAAKNLIGILPRVKEVKSLICTTSNNVQIIGIWGMGGAGKTTLAWAVFNEISYQFQGRSYVANIREVSGTSGLHCLQEKVLSDLLSERDMKVTSVLEGIELMANRLCRKKILLVLDDVNDEAQLEALAGSRDWFGTGSRIIITTRDEHCLRILGVDKTYKPVMLDDSEAVELFSLHAFKRSRPPREHKELSKWVVQYAAGHPLSLKVLGSFLNGRDMKEWKSALERLEVAPDEKLYEILKISFDGLAEMEQKIFLDIACFFKGKERDYVTRILDSFDFCADIGVSILIQKSLISVSKGRLCMHDRIQEMGWHIVRKSSSNLGEHSRLWLPKDVCDVLTNKTGTDAVEGIYLELTDEENHFSVSADTFKSMLKVRFLYINSRKNWETPKFQILSHRSKLISKGTRYLPNKWFSKGTLFLPSKLQWLTWNGYLSESLPESFEGDKLVGLEMSDSKIIQLWRGRKTLNKLRFIDLCGSTKLRSIPDLKGTPNLKSLILENCLSLVEIHPSVVDLKQLVFLSLYNCRSLASLPSPLQMESLETLNLSSCASLTKFPEISKNMGTLSKLDLDSTSIKELPESFGNLIGLVLLKLSWCECLRSLPESVGRLKSLRSLDLSNSSRLKTLPNSLGQVQSLKKLFLNGSAIEEIPSFIVYLKDLKTLSLHGCKASMASLSRSGSVSYKSGSVQCPLPSYGFIKELVASRCNLSEGNFSGEFSSLRSLEKLNLSGNPLKYLPHSICQLPRLNILDVSNCCNLEELQRLPSSITELRATDCERLTSFLDIRNYKNLWMLNMPSEDGGWENSVDSVLQSLLQGHIVGNHRFSIQVPGNIIPEWFSEQSWGLHMNLQLPSGWCNEDILGFAICTNVDYSAFQIAIGFKMIELGEMQQQELMLTPPPEEPSLARGQVWLGFLSIDFFKLLFPDFTHDDWSKFEGFLSMQLSLLGRPFSEYKKCAIRIVYKEDLKGGERPTFQNSTDQTWLKYILDDEDEDDDDDDDEDVGGEYRFRSILPSFKTAYLKKAGPMGALVQFRV